MGCCHSGNASASAGTPVDDAGDQEHRKVLLLSDSPLLIHLTEPQLKELAGLFTVHQFAADTVIFTAGDPADCLCFVGEGEVGLLVDDDSDWRNVPLLPALPAPPSPPVVAPAGSVSSLSATNTHVSLQPSLTGASSAVHAARDPTPVTEQSRIVRRSHTQPQDLDQLRLPIQPVQPRHRRFKSSSKPPTPRPITNGSKRGSVHVEPPPCDLPQPHSAKDPPTSTRPVPPRRTTSSTSLQLGPSAKFSRVASLVGGDVNGQDHVRISCKKEGDFFGNVGLSRGSHTHWHYTVKSLVDCTVLMLKRDELQRYLREHPQNRKVVLNALGDDFESHLDQVPLLRGLSPKQRHLLASMLHPVSVAKDKDLFLEGQVDELGNSLFIVLSGRLLAIANVAGKPTTLNQFTPGMYFGEIGLIADMPRTATMKAVEQSLVLELMRDDFLRFLALDGVASLRDEIQQTLNGRLVSHFQKYEFSLWSSLTADNYELLGRLCEMESVEPGHVFYKEHDPANAFYMVASGRIALKTRRKGSLSSASMTPSQNRVEFAAVCPGDYFGAEVLQVVRRAESESKATVKPLPLLRTSSAEATERSVVVKLPLQAILQFHEQVPESFAKFMVATSQMDAVKLKHVLHHPLGLHFFWQHLATEFNTENIEFWVAARHFSSRFSRYSARSTNSSISLIPAVPEKSPDSNDTHSTAHHTPHPPSHPKPSQTFHRASLHTPMHPVEPDPHATSAPLAARRLDSREHLQAAQVGSADDLLDDHLQLPGQADEDSSNTDSGDDGDDYNADDDDHNNNNNNNNNNKNNNNCNDDVRVAMENGAHAERPARQSLALPVVDEHGPAHPAAPATDPSMVASTTCTTGTTRGSCVTSTGSVRPAPSTRYSMSGSVTVKSGLRPSGSRRLPDSTSSPDLLIIPQANTTKFVVIHASNAPSPLDTSLPPDRSPHDSDSLTMSSFLHPGFEAAQKAPSTDPERRSSFVNTFGLPDQGSSLPVAPSAVEIAEMVRRNTTFTGPPDEMMEAMKKEAAAIVARFIDLDGDRSINIKADIRDAILRSFHPDLPARHCGANPRMFNAARREIFRLMDSDPFPRFKQSPQFKEYLKLSQEEEHRRRSVSNSGRLPSSSSHRGSSFRSTADRSTYAQRTANVAKATKHFTAPPSPHSMNVAPSSRMFSAQPEKKKHNTAPIDVARQNSVSDMKAAEPEEEEENQNFERSHSYLSRRRQGHQTRLSIFSVASEASEKHPPA